MADNVTLPATGEVVATEEIAGRHIQLLKLIDGLVGSTVRARVLAANADASTAGVVVRNTPQDTWSVSFTRASAAGLNAPGMTQRRLGAGMTATQVNGNLVVGGGTTANSEFLARSDRSFNGALIHRHQLIASQRIANTNYSVMLADMVAEAASCTINSATSISVTVTAHGLTADNVGQSMFVGAITGANGVPGRYAIASIPNADTINFTVAGWPASGSCTVDLFGWSYIRWLYTGTTATAAAVDAQRYGYASGDTSATINSTASPGHMAQTQVDGRSIYFQDALVASSTAPAVSNRAHRWANIPDQDVELYVYVWCFNGTTNPASSTTWTLGFIAVEDTVNLPVYLAGARQMGASTPIPVAQTVAGPTQPVSGTVTANIGTGSIAAGTAAIGDVGVQYRASATGAASPTNLNSPATPAVQTIKASAGRLLGLVLTNTGAATRFLKVFNATAPTLGTSAAILDIAIPANQCLEVHLEGGIAFATAITCAVTGGRGVTDNTAIAAGDVTGFALAA